MHTALPDYLVDGLADCLDRNSLHALASFKLSSEAEARLDALAEKANEGTLSAAETEEYESFIRGSELLAQAQLRARSRLGLPLVA